MSLKKFHLFFISTSLSLMVFIGGWVGYQFQMGKGKDWLGTGAIAVVGFILGLIYANWFRVKYKNL